MNMHYLSEGVVLTYMTFWRSNYVHHMPRHNLYPNLVMILILTLNQFNPKINRVGTCP